VAILGIILAMMAASFHTVAGSKIHAEGRLYAERTGRAILWQMSNEIRGAVQTPVTPSRVLMLGVAQYNSGTPINSLTVSTIDPGHRRSISAFGAEDIVSYRALPNPRHRGWFLLQRTQQSSLAYGNKQPMPIIVADNLLSMRIRYFDGQQWGEVWNSENMSLGHQLPIAVTLDVDLAAPNGRDMTFSTQITLPMAVEQW